MNSKTRAGAESWWNGDGKDEEEEAATDVMGPVWTGTTGRQTLKFCKDQEAVRRGQRYVFASKRGDISLDNPWDVCGPQPWTDST